MAITLPSTDPVEDYYRPLSPGRILLVENTDLPWSVALTRQYARRKRIPVANIISVAMGTNTTTWTPASTAALNTALIQPVTTAWNAVAAQAVLMGPGTPQKVVIYGEVTDQVLATVNASSAGSVGLANLAAGAKRVAAYIATYGTDVLTWIAVSGSGNRASLCDAGVVFFEYLNGGNYRAALTGTGGLIAPTYGTAYTGIGSTPEGVTLPTQTAIDLLGDTGNITVLQGKIGIGWTRDAYSQDSTYPSEYEETAESAARVMYQALDYGAGLNPANRYQQPVHIQFGANSSTYQQTLAYLVDQLDGWGYPVTYTWRQQNGTAEMLTYAPYAGSAYSLEDLQQGRVRDFPYHLMAGDASNLEQPDRPYNTAWEPSGGAGVYLGPSEGWQYAINGLLRGAAGVASNSVHVTTRLYGAAYGILHNLLRGFTWAEAIYFSSYGEGEVLATGDPLARPYPRD